MASEPRINREMALEDYESTLRLLGDMRSLIRSDHLTVETRLHAIDHAITEAVGGLPERARDYLRDVMLGLEDGGRP